LSCWKMNCSPAIWRIAGSMLLDSMQLVTVARAVHFHSGFHKYQLRTMYIPTLIRRPDTMSDLLKVGRVYVRRSRSAATSCFFVIAANKHGHSEGIERRSDSIFSSEKSMKSTDDAGYRRNSFFARVKGASQSATVSPWARS